MPPQEIRISWQPPGPSVVVAGNLSLESLPVRRRIATWDPEELYRQVLTAALVKQGVRVGPHGTWTATPGRDPLLVHHSPPLGNIVRVMLKSSDNLIAETLVRSLGLQAGGDFSFAAGREKSRVLVAPLGLDLDRARYADGSGLSRYNHLSPAQLNSLLLAMVRGGGRMATLWRDMLPLAGHDGTLKSRFRGTPLEGNLRAKTGSMSSVRALSGYLTARSGKEYAFSILVNGYVAQGSEVDGEIDRILLAAHYGL
jgi:D-alanyl-D-alanine carboxypeptidase/D-alanyl-D-alanine-endopeptidase (penicillin-binding protein 4)